MQRGTTCLSAAQRARKQLGAETNASKNSGKCGQIRQKRPQTPEKYTANVVNFDRNDNKRQRKITANVVNFGRNDNKRQRKNTANVSKIRKNDNKHRKSEATHALASRVAITRRRGRRKFRSKAPTQPQSAAQSDKPQKSTNRAHAHCSRERANAPQLPQNRALP